MLPLPTGREVNQGKGTLPYVRHRPERNLLDAIFHVTASTIEILIQGAVFEFLGSLGSQVFYGVLDGFRVTVVDELR